MMTPVELEIELFCRGLRLAPGSDVADEARRISRTRAGLGSGLELVIPRKPKPEWVNVPVVEDYAKESPFELFSEGGNFYILSGLGIRRDRD